MFSYRCFIHSKDHKTELQLKIEVKSGSHKELNLHTKYFAIGDS